ncbi:unnamed protein product [Agarophyton chilense]
MVVDKETPLLNVFGLKGSQASLCAIRKSNKKLASLVHPDPWRSDPRGSARSMRTLSRAMDLVRSDFEYAKIHFDLQEDDDYRLKRQVRFQYFETNHEQDVVEVQRRRKQEQQRPEDEIRASHLREHNERLRKQREARHNEDAEARAREFLERELQTQREMRANDARNNQQDFMAAHKEKD